MVLEGGGGSTQRQIIRQIRKSALQLPVAHHRSAKPKDADDVEYYERNDDNWNHNNCHCNYNYN